MFTKEKLKYTKCYCILGDDSSWRINHQFLNSIIGYFKDHRQMLKNFLSIDRKYKEKKGEIDAIEKLQLDKLETLSLYSNSDSSLSNVLLTIDIGFQNLVYLELLDNLPFDLKAFITHALRNFSRIVYGYKYQGTFGRFSESYAFGQKKNIDYLKGIGLVDSKYFTSWLERSDLVKEGFFRDIYSENILNKNHINKLSSLKRNIFEYIDSDKKLGRISIILKNECFYWEIDPKNLDYVRQQFYDKSIIIQ